jgi:deazaflavin-dependent oxidoreductase (nitroreductase family)
MRTADPSTPHPNSQRSGSSPGYRVLSGIGRRRFDAFQHWFNAFFLRFAGSRSLRLYGVVRHRGRRSGRAYATPLIVRPTTDGFVLPLLAGEGADWFQNVRAAGGCVIRWNGREYDVADPVVIDWAAARPWFGRLARIYVTLLGFQRFVRVRYAAARTEDPVVMAQRSK